MNISGLLLTPALKLASQGIALTGIRFTGLLGAWFSREEKSTVAPNDSFCLKGKPHLIAQLEDLPKQIEWLEDNFVYFLHYLFI